MCGGSFFSSSGSSSLPPVQKAPPIVRTQPRSPAIGLRKSGDDQTARARAFAASGGTLITGPGGLSSSASTQKKTLLGA